MDCFVGQRHALKCLRAFDSLKGLKRGAARPRPLTIPNVDRLFRCLDDETGWREGTAVAWRTLREVAKAGAPLDLMVADRSSRSNSKRVQCHVWTIPSHGTWHFELGNSCALSAPEACFFQLARTLDDIALMKVGFELCGSYSLDERSRVGFRTRPPLTDVASLRRFADKMGSAKGVERARRCLQYVRDNSASPMETCLALIFGLPNRLGGYGLGVPELNVPVSAPAHARKKVGYSNYHCDLLWQQHRVAVEYNSRAFHLEEQAAARDSARMNDLALFNLTVFTMTRLQIADRGETERLVRLIAGSMGKRLVCERADIDQRRSALRKALFAKDDLA